VFDHIGLQVRDLAASVRFYEAALAPLGFVLCSRDETSAGLGPKDAPALWLYADPKAAPARTHLALSAGSRQAVQQFHAAAIEAGGADNGAPGPRADYSPTYYAAFVRDPDGNNVEAVTYR
jgi:catechol 2,3-dioxygenase-like lactoylglutathione lyase family enzyme